MADSSAESSGQRAALYCSARSREICEELAGTAPANLRWALLLEHARPYARQTLDTLPAPLALRVGGLLERSGSARLQLIHQPGVEVETPRVFVVETSTPRLARVPYAQLVDGDASTLEQLMAHGAAQESPLYLVCVHGRRDACCAKRGVAFERALAAQLPERVFQTSHIGGHRFAATAVVYPEALYYGRLEAADAETLSRAHEAGRVGPTEKLRGRASRAAEAQAAEVFACRRRGSVAPMDLGLALLPSGDYEFDAEAGRGRLRVERHALPADSPKGCSDEPVRLSAFVERRGVELG